jgi:hypothetical protein
MTRKSSKARARAEARPDRSRLDDAALRSIIGGRTFRLRPAVQAGQIAIGMKRIDL